MSSEIPPHEKVKRLAKSLGLHRIYQQNEDLSFIRIENCIGFTKVPVGLAGPLRITGPGVNDSLYAPLATYEATLVASCSRGCKAFENSGGVHFKVLGEGMSRGPVFKFQAPERAIAFYRAIPTLKIEFTRWAESTSRHVRLQAWRPAIIGSNVYGDKLDMKGFFVEGQLASDKKPSWGNVMEPRGVQVMAWGIVDPASCQKYLGCTTEQWLKLYKTAVDGAIRQGHFGCNINTSNIVAALFTSTGQDIGSVAEASWSQLTCELDDKTKSITLSVFFPSLTVGIVGGGTSYATQKEALEVLGCTGPNRKGALAGIIASFALALDVSTSASIINNTFTDAHMRLARGENGVRVKL